MTWTWGIRDFGATQSRVERELVLVNPFPIGRTLNLYAAIILRGFRGIGENIMKNNRVSTNQQAQENHPQEKPLVKWFWRLVRVFNIITNLINWLEGGE